MDIWFYLLLTLTFLSAVVCFITYMFPDKEALYFRFHCDNPLTIDLYDYVQAREFFTLFNDRLSEYLTWYVQNHFYTLGVAYDDLKLHVDVNFYTISAVCYVKADSTQRKSLPQKIINGVELSKKTAEFYTFYQQTEHTEKRRLLKFTLPDSTANTAVQSA